MHGQPHIRFNTIKFTHSVPSETCAGRHFWHTRYIHTAVIYVFLLTHPNFGCCVLDSQASFYGHVFMTVWCKLKTAVPTGGNHWAVQSCLIFMQLIKSVRLSCLLTQYWILFDKFLFIGPLRIIFTTLKRTLLKQTPHKYILLLIFSVR